MSRRLLLPAIVLTSLIGVGLALLTTREPSLDALATDFIRTALAYAQHQPDEVDSYIGPASLKPALHAPLVPIAVLSQRARHLVAQLELVPVSDRSDRSDRRSRLHAEARALATVIDMSRRLTFDEEARNTYGFTFVEGADADVQIDTALAALDRALPRSEQDGASLAARFEAYRRRFLVPADRRRAVFEAALDACRARTAAHWTLPAGEHLEVKWDISAPAAWHRYEGHGRSTLTINPAAVTFVDTAIDLACHEGYPGHHAQFLLADRTLAGVSMPVEETVALLRSPVAMLREAAANYAVDLAFPPAERLQFERDTLLPLAGLDPATATAGTAGTAKTLAADFEIRRLVRALEPTIIPILRDYRDGRVTAAEASDGLERRALVSSPQALLRFVDELGPYVLGYTVARDRVALYIASDTHASAGREDAWRALAMLLTSPEPERVFSSTSLVSPPASTALPRQTASAAR